MNTFNYVLYVGLPYMAIVLCIVGATYRYRATGFTFSSLSSQFLEGDKLFFGSLLLHWSILMLVLGHLFAFLLPAWVLALNSDPMRLIVHEMVGFTFGMSALLGLTWLFIRRIMNERIRVVTNPMDIIIELLIITQFFLGCWIALGYRWGSSWFAADLSPYLWSLLKLNPQIEAISNMPLVIMTHVALAFVIIGMIPFTRLVHFMVAPLHYIPRPYQRVIWYWDRKRIRDPRTPWAEVRPKNN